MKLHSVLQKAIMISTLVSALVLNGALLSGPSTLVKAQSDTASVDEWATSASATSQYGTTSWSASQATGPANVPACGDDIHAWASLTQNGKDALTVGFDTAVIPSQIKIYQNYHPGAITGIDLIPADDSTPIALPNSADPGTQCPDVFAPTITGVSVAVKGAIIHLDQSKTNYWNEIDAVELLGTTVKLAKDAPRKQWAINASATSQYGDPDWSASQATGEPNVTACGDNTKAWASRTPNGKDDLTLTFAEAVIPDNILIYQTYNPGSITSIDLIPVDGGKPVAVPISAKPDTQCPSVLSVTIGSDNTPFVKSIVIHLDQSKIGNWDEIDAVQLIGSLVRATTRSMWATGASATSQYGNPDWSASQATGAPNVTDCADNTKAWASSAPNSKDDLTVTFPSAVIPKSLKIYETFTPGAITGVDLLPANGGAAIPLPNSADPGTPCPGTFVLTISSVSVPVNGAIIHLDQSKTRHWNEIDAVQLSGQPAN